MKFWIKGGLWGAGILVTLLLVLGRINHPLISPSSFSFIDILVWIPEKIYLLFDPLVNYISRPLFNILFFGVFGFILGVIALWALKNLIQSIREIKK